MIPGRTCQAKEITWVSGFPPAFITNICGKPATSLWDYGCEHEHIQTDMATCDDHKPRDGEVGCYQCINLGHDCPMTFRPAQAAR